MCGVCGNNAFGDCGGDISCIGFSGGAIDGNTENCALKLNSSGNALVSDVGEECYADLVTRKPAFKIEECNACTWGYEEQDSTQTILTQCGNFKVRACLPKQMAEVECLDYPMYVETFSNENGCADGERLWFPTDNYGYLGPIEHCKTCQSGYKLINGSVDIEGCSNGPFDVDYCESTRECTRARDCEGWVMGGAPVDPVKKPGLLKVITCTEAGKCTYHFRCDEDPGYYNGPASSNLGPTSCIKCPLYQGKYGDGHIRRLTRDTSITGCFIENGTTINATEGTFVLDSHCYY